MTQPRTFATHTPDWRASALILGAIVLLVFGLSWFSASNPQDQRMGMLGAVLITAFIGALLALALLRRKVWLQDGQLRVNAGINSLRVPVNELDIAHARIVNMDENPDYRLGFRTFGTQLPGYHAGHFRQGSGLKTFALVTAKQRVLLIPRQGERRIMLSLAQPQALLDALRAAQTPTTP